MIDRNDANRRFFLQTAGLGAAGMAVTGLGLSGIAQAALLAPTQPAAADASPTMGPFRHVRAGELDIAYIEMGPAKGKVAILLHGWPYDIHCYEEVAPLLANAGYRVVIPYLRGYGATRFVSADTLRNGQQAALATDVIALMRDQRGVTIGQ